MEPSAGETEGAGALQRGQAFRAKGSAFAMALSSPPAARAGFLRPALRLAERARGALESSWHKLPLRRRIGLLIIATVAPLLLFDLEGCYRSYQEARDQAARDALFAARTLASVIESDITGRQNSLEVLGVSESLKTGNFEAFRSEAQAVVARHWPGSNVILLRADGQQLVNTFVPPGEPLPRRKAVENHDLVVDSGTPRVSDVFLGAVLRQPIITIDVPVRGPRGEPLILTLDPRLDLFDRIIKRYRPDPAWAVSVIDRKGVFIARVPDGELQAGRQAPHDYRRHLQGNAEGFVETASPDGTAVFASFARMSEPDWTVSVEVPQRLVITPALLRSAVPAFWSALALGFGLLLARLVSRSITKPLLRLRRFAADPDRLASDASATRTGLPDTDEVAEVLAEETRHRNHVHSRLADSERRLRVVVRELNHRAKNALATVQALAYQTARAGFGEETKKFVEIFSERLSSIARAHDLLASNSWEPVRIGRVVKAGVAPWCGAGVARIRFDEQAGPSVSPRQAQALMLALHELATNATKHGALSNPDGSVQVRVSAGDGHRIAIEWAERGGPPIAGEPTRRGFGQHLLRRVVARDLGDDAEVHMDYRPEGLVAQFRFAASEPPAEHRHG